jgi:hypothetical protein
MKKVRKPHYYVLGLCFLVLLAVIVFGNNENVEFSPDPTNEVDGQSANSNEEPTPSITSTKTSTDICPSMKDKSCSTSEDRSLSAPVFSTLNEAYSEGKKKCEGTYEKCIISQLKEKNYNKEVCVGANCEFSNKLKTDHLCSILFCTEYKSIQQPEGTQEKCVYGHGDINVGPNGIPVVNPGASGTCQTLYLVQALTPGWRCYFYSEYDEDVYTCKEPPQNGNG